MRDLVTAVVTRKVGYLAMVSMAGASEAWYVSPYASHAALGDSLKPEDADPVLSAKLAQTGSRRFRCLQQGAPGPAPPIAYTKWLRASPHPRI